MQVVYSPTLLNTHTIVSVQDAPVASAIRKREELDATMLKCCDDDQGDVGSEEYSILFVNKLMYTTEPGIKCAKTRHIRYPPVHERVSRNVSIAKKAR